MIGRVVVYINGRFLTQKTTGVQRFAREIVLALSQLRDDVVIVTPKLTLDNRQCNMDFYRKLNIVEVGKMQGHIWEQIELLRFMHSTKNGILLNLCNTAPIFYNFNIYTLHDVIFKRYPKSYDFKFRWFYNILSSMLLKKSIEIFTVSNFSKDEIIKFYPWVDVNKINIVYNAVPTVLNGCANLIREGSVRNTTFITQAYFNDNKNIYVILDALKLIKRNDFKISIIGDLSEKEPEKLEEALKDARVEYLGRVSDEKLVFLYSTSLAYIIPSRIEGFGIPALEAQKFGCPVISSNTGSLPEILKESAIFFNPEDPKELASLILMLLDSNANIINELINNGYVNANRFSFQKSAEIVDRVLNKYL